MKDEKPEVLDVIGTAEDCDCKEGMFPDPGRRALLLGGAALAGTGLFAGRAGAEATQGASQHAVLDDPTSQPGPASGGGYGLRSQFETVSRWEFPLPQPGVSGSFTPLAGTHGTITPSGLHYEVHRGGVPTIDPARHKLLIHGKVKRAKVFTMADLYRFPSVTRTAFLECAGNGGMEYAGPSMPHVQGTHGLTSNSEWTGVALSTLLREVGLEDGANWLLGEGSDAGMHTRSIPIDKAMDDAVLAYAQNGEAIRPEQGYPLRLLLPGFEGNMSIKWLRRLDVTDKPSFTRPEVTTYADTLADGTTRYFTWEMEAKSVITFPSGTMKLPIPGTYEVTGLAWSGRGKITGVEVSADGGKTWARANLVAPVLSMAHTRFTFGWRWDGKPAILQSRATDETGYVQPTITALVDVRGVNSKDHNNGIQSWAIDAEGNVTNVHA